MINFLNQTYSIFNEVNPNNGNPVRTLTYFISFITLMEKFIPPETKSQTEKNQIYYAYRYKRHQ